MCGRYTSTSSPADLAEIFEVDEIKTEPVEPRYNVAPTVKVYAVAVSKDAGEKCPRRQLGAFRWGLVPSWAKDRTVASKLINARCETVATKPAFRAALARRRCLIPADSFFEWQRRAAPDGRPGGKLPFVIRRSDGAPLAFAGLWEVWRDPEDPDAEPLRTCAIVTTTANSVMRPIHDRMPVILERSSWDAWLAPGTGPEQLAALMAPAGEQVLETYPVSSLVNKVSNDGPELLVALPAPPEGVVLF